MTEPGPSPPDELHRVWTLRIAREIDRETVVLVVAGRLGTVSSGTLVDALLREIRAGCTRILVDLGGVDYVSSAGLLALQAIVGRVHEARGELVLCSLAEPVRLVFDLAGLLPSLPVEPSRHAGLARLRQ
jgi:anti-anti-sigma factor